MKQKLDFHADMHLWDRSWPQSREEFNELIDAFADRLFNAAFRRLGRVHDAEDVLQTVFLKAYSISFEKKNIPIGPYLYKMLMNACHDHNRKKRSGDVSTSDFDDNCIESHGYDPSEIAVTKDKMMRIDVLLSKLPDVQAETVRLRVFDQLRLSEIAEITDSTVDTVSSRLRYAFQKLRKMVSKGTLL